jgi:c-di-GMP-binding flagellar brake protein YcgR
MARALRRWLGGLAGARSRTPAAAQVPTVDGREIRHLLLKQVLEAHSLLEVRLENSGEAYSSAILELVPAEGYLVLDALAPASARRFTSTLPDIRVRARLHGMDLKFSSRIEHCGGQPDLPWYRVPYPATVDYPQRRRDFRVAVPLDRSVAVRFSTGEGAPIRGELRDLSLNGFCARVLAGDIERLNVGNGLALDCELDLPGMADPLRAKVDARHLLRGRARSAPRVGVRFLEIDADSARGLEHCIAELERKPLRSG